MRLTSRELKLEDEYWTLVLSLPVIAVVIPGAGHIVLSGFDALGHAPEWYQAAVAASIAFAFGKPVVRGTRSLILQKRLNGAK